MSDPATMNVGERRAAIALFLARAATRCVEAQAGFPHRVTDEQLDTHVTVPARRNFENGLDDVRQHEQLCDHAGGTRAKGHVA